MADWTCSVCTWVNRGFADKCLSCGADKSRGVPSAGAAAGSTASPAIPRPNALAAPTLATPSRPSVAFPAPGASVAGGFLGGLAAGLVAAVVATVLWYAVVALSEYQIGFVAVLVGWLIGTAVVFGSRGRIGIPLILASGLLTLASLAVSEYLIVYHFLTQELGAAIDLIQSPALVLEIVVESLRADPAALVFWAFAVGAAVYIPLKRLMPSIPRI